MSVRSSYRIVFTTSVTCVVRLTCGDVRWTRSPIPVSDGVNTSCPASRSGPRTYLNPYDPPHAPWTRTNVVLLWIIDRTLAEGRGGGKTGPRGYTAVS